MTRMIGPWRAPAAWPVRALAVCGALAGSGPARALENPASAFCATMGGQTILAKLPDGGTIGLCALPGRKIVEEWTLYRMLRGVKPAPGADPFR